jgi:hypothetical protein
MIAEGIERTLNLERGLRMAGGALKITKPTAPAPYIPAGTPITPQPTVGPATWLDPAKATAQVTMGQRLYLGHFKPMRWERWEHPPADRGVTPGVPLIDDALRTIDDPVRALTAATRVLDEDLDSRFGETALDRTALESLAQDQREIRLRSLEALGPVLGAAQQKLMGVWMRPDKPYSPFTRHLAQTIVESTKVYTDMVQFASAYGVHSMDHIQDGGSWSEAFRVLHETESGIEFRANPLLALAAENLLNFFAQYGRVVRNSTHGVVFVVDEFPEKAESNPRYPASREEMDALLHMLGWGIAVRHVITPRIDKTESVTHTLPVFHDLGRYRDHGEEHARMISRTGERHYWTSEPSKSLVIAIDFFAEYALD